VKISSYDDLKPKNLAINVIKVFEISSTHLYTSLVKDPIVGYAKNKF